MLAYADQLPRLQAEEELRLVNATGAGSGAMEQRDRQAYLKRLRRMAGIETAIKPRTLGDWQRAGIPVVIEQKE